MDKNVRPLELRGCGNVIIFYPALLLSEPCPSQAALQARRGADLNLVEGAILDPIPGQQTGIGVV